MSKRKDRTADDRFQPKAGPSKQRDQAFVTQILREASRAGFVGRKANHQPGARLGRGHVAARFRGPSTAVDSRRVTIKTRLVNLRQSGRRSTATHLRYIEREGVGREGEPGQAYGPVSDRADLEAFEARGRNDRHQFRFIVSAEDAESLAELRTFTRHLMDRVESDLGTRLDWVAVDHWNTDNPHTHIALRGKDENGKDLVIARDYIAHGMRFRAAELATEWLGPRTEREIQRSLQREITQDRMTSLDRTLVDQNRNQVIRLKDLARHPRRQQLIGRLQHLQQLGLANEIHFGHWRIDADAQRRLRAMGERGDIIRSMQRAMADTQREFNIVEPGSGHALVGRLVDKGLAGESHDRGYLVIDGLDGKAHHVTLARSLQLSCYPLGAVIEVRTSFESRAVDRRIASLAVEGFYQRKHHLAALAADRTFTRNAEPLLDAHDRRLEALRRAGIVERSGEGVWHIPNDLVEQGQRHDLQRTGGLTLTVRTPMPIERQIRAVGATWLDTQLVSGAKPISERGFGAQVQVAIGERTDYLVEQGLAQRKGPRVLLARNLLKTLRERELAAVALDIETQTGQRYRAMVDGRPASGVYRRSMELISGRYALLDDGTGFSLVPWKPVIEPRLGRHMTALVHDDHVSWQLGRSRGPAVS